MCPKVRENDIDQYDEHDNYQIKWNKWKKLVKNW